MYLFSSFFFNDTATPEIYTLSLHDALPISDRAVHDPALDEGLDDVGMVADEVLAGHHEVGDQLAGVLGGQEDVGVGRSEEHTSELQSQFHLVCRLLLEKKKKKKQKR